MIRNLARGGLAAKAAAAAAVVGGTTTSALVVVVTAAAAGGGAATTYCTASDASSSSLTAAYNNNNNNKQQQQHYGAVVKPTLEATRRALRLVSTAARIAFDYQTAKYSSSSSSNNNNNHNEQQEYWEQQVESRLQALQQAQDIYANESPTEHTQNMTPVRRMTVKRTQKQIMMQAAEELAFAEEQLQKHGGSTKSQFHTKQAKRLLQLCHANKGVYIKVGQHLANLDYLIPEEYIEMLATLFDDNPVTSYADVTTVVQEDLGATPEDLFASFDQIPIASASLAQVHIATEKGTGRKLAVKVQHRGLRETSVGDTRALAAVVRTMEWLFPDFAKWGWICDELEPLLPKELDFVNEGRNAERAAAHLKTTGLACVVPAIVWKYTSPRVLTMEFEEGFKVTDTKALQESKLCPSQVAKLLSSVFASQIFQACYVHSDPHPANVLLRANKRSGKPELVLLDHGLYRELDLGFARDYAALWKSIMLADIPGIREACRRLGVEETYTLFAGLLTARPFDEILERAKTKTLDHRKGRRAAAATASSGQSNSSTAAAAVVVGSQAADKAVIKSYAHRYLNEILRLLAKIPRQMLLLLKTNDCLRHIDHSLGSPTNTIVVNGSYAALAVYQHEWAEAKSWLDRLRAWFHYMQIVVRIKAYETFVLPGSALSMF